MSRNKATKYHSRSIQQDDIEFYINADRRHIVEKLDSHRFRTHAGKVVVTREGRVQKR